MTEREREIAAVLRAVKPCGLLLEGPTLNGPLVQCGKSLADPVHDVRENPTSARHHEWWPDYDPMARASARDWAVVVYGEIADEVARQKTLKAQGKFAHTPSDVEMDDGDKLGALIEEVGEAAEAMIERHGLIGKPKGTDLRKELIQAAAVAAAWVEAIDAEAIRRKPA